jgi:DNA-directed RNA polymerase subunit RPC12/RpoP
MAGVTYYVQECPTCGRRLQVRVEYMGKAVACRHCSANFVATNSAGGRAASHSGLSLLARADELIEAADSGLLDQYLSSRQTA